MLVGSKKVEFCVSIHDCGSTMDVYRIAAINIHLICTKVQKVIGGTGLGEKSDSSNINEKFSEETQFKLFQTC